MADEMNPTLLPVPPCRLIIQDRSDESLHSEADSLENTESELGLGHGWDYKNKSNEEIGEIGDSICTALTDQGQEKFKLKVAVDDIEDDEEDGQLKDIFFRLIPSEITDLIFRRLDQNSKLCSRCVCKHWCDLVDNGNLLTWWPTLFDGSSQEVMTFAEKGYDVQMLEIFKLESFQYPAKGLRLNTRGIHFNTSSDRGLIRTGISNVNLHKLLYEYHSHIEELLLDSGAFTLVNLPSPFRTMGFSNLVALEIYTSTADARGYYVCLDALENTFPNLKSIKLRLFYDRETIFQQHPPYYKDIFNFIIKHSSTLESILIFHSNLTIERTIPPFVFDMDHAIPVRVYQGMMDDLRKIQLSELTFGPTFYEGRSRYMFGIQLMNAQNHLTYLNLVNLSRPNFTVWESAIQLMTRCSSSLKFIICEGCFCPENRPLDIFSCGILSNSKQLTTLQITICGLKITDVELLPRSVKVLHLGRGLSGAQIIFIANNLKELTEWSLPQDRAQFDRTIPKTSVVIFKNICKLLTKLKTLILTKRCSSWKRIRKIISYTQGLKIGDPDPNFVKIIIDRSRLELYRL